MTAGLTDPERCRAVTSLGLVDTPPQQRFDRLTRTAQRVLDVPVALLNLVDDSTLWVTSGIGLDVRQVPADIALCTHAVTSGRVLVVGDTRADARFATNPLVVADDGIRAYLGHPLRLASGLVIGTLCVMDVVVRDWTPADVDALGDLVAWAEAELAHDDVTRALAEGERLRREYESVLDHAGQGILGVDRTGTVLLANVAALRLTGWQELGLVGRDLHDTVHPVDVRGEPCTVATCSLAQAVRQGRAILRQDAVLWRRDSSPLPVQVSCAPVYADGKLTGAVLVFGDITERLEVDRMKDEFVSVVSHELRTPLTSLRGSLGLLSSGLLGELTTQGQDMARVAVASTDRLVRLVDDILDLESLVAGQVTLSRRVVTIAELVDRAVLALAEPARTAQVHLDVDDATVWVDPERIVQVLVNLLDNAVKFSPAGAPAQVTGRLLAEGDLELTVHDRGRGIPPEQLERVFDRFAQVDASDTRAHGGSGIGLAIVRNVVERHGGTVTATSSPDHGTRFTVVVPQRRSAGHPRPAGRRTGDLATT